MGAAALTTAGTKFRAGIGPLMPGVAVAPFPQAYRYGWESRKAHMDKTFDEAEPTLAQDWDVCRGTCPLSWDQAREAARDAWDRCNVTYGSAAANQQQQSDANQSNLGEDRVL